MRDTPWPGRNQRSDSAPYYEFLGRAIKVERTARGMDRKILAERAGLSYPYVSEIENGSKRPSSQAVLQIAGALGLEPSELMAVAEQLQVAEGRRRTDPERAEHTAMSRPMSSFHMPALAADAVPWRSTGPRDEREELIERIRLLVAALDLDDLMRVSDLVDRLRR